MLKGSRSKVADSVQPKHAEFSIEQSVEATIQEMLKEREENPSVVLPMKFVDYYNSPELLELIKAIHSYCKELFKLESKLQSLEEEAKSKGLPMPTLLPSETRRLQEKAKEMAMKYGWILINNKIGRNRQEDHSFYETIIKFVIRVLTPAFEKQEITRLDEELNRLFRSTAFNMSHRRMVEEEKVRKFPQFRPFSKKESEDSLIKRIEVRNRIPKDKLKIDPHKTNLSRPGYVKLSPFKAITSRSPLISLIFPSPRDKIRAFEEERKSRMAPKKQEKLQASEAREIIRNELRKRQTSL